MEEDALILPLAFYRDPKIVMEKTDIHPYATLQSTLLFFFGIFCIDASSNCLVCLVFLGGLMQHLKLVKSWLNAFDLVSGQSGCGWKTWQTQLANWCIKVNVSNTTRWRETATASGFAGNSRNTWFCKAANEKQTWRPVAAVMLLCGQAVKWGGNEQVSGVNADTVKVLLVFNTKVHSFYTLK